MTDNQIDNYKALQKQDTENRKLIKKLQLDKQALKEQLHIADDRCSAFLVQHRETLINYGLFSTRKKAESYINNNENLFKIQEVEIA